MTVTTELADLVWENPDVREQFFLLSPNLASLPAPWPGVEHHFPGPIQHVFPYEDAIASLASGEMTYFGVIPRKEPTDASRLEVIEHSWCLWVDIDDPDGLEAVERELRPLDFWPSAIVSTGSRGHHLYFRLATSLPLPLIELYNRALAQLVGADTRYTPMPNIVLKVPGTVHEKSGGTAQLVEMSGAAYGENALRRLNASLVPVLASVMETPQRHCQKGERELERTLKRIERRERRASERHRRNRRKQKRLTETREELDRRQKRLTETREELDRRARALDAQRKALELRGDNGRRPLVAQRLRRRLARLARAARN